MEAATRKAKFREWWQANARDWVPRQYAASVAGVSRQAIVKAIATQRLRTKSITIGEIVVDLVFLDDLEKIGVNSNRKGK